MQIIRHLHVLAASLVFLEGESFQFSSLSQSQQSHAMPTTRLHLSSVESRLRTADVERKIVGLGRRGKTDRAIELFHSVDMPSLRMLNNAIDACARARPTRLNEAFQLLEDGIEKKRLKPNVFTFGALMSACSRARAGDRAVKLLRSMKVSFCCIIRMGHVMIPCSIASPRFTFPHTRLLVFSFTSETIWCQCKCCCVFFSNIGVFTYRTAAVPNCSQVA